MKVLALPRPIQPHARIGARNALVAHMTKETGVSVLANRGAELHPESDIGELGRLGRELVHWESPQQDEPATLVQCLDPLGHGDA